jgi:hypothetical protein
MRKTAFLLTALFGAALVGCGSSTVSVPDGKTEKAAGPPRVRNAPLRIYHHGDEEGAFEVEVFYPSLAQHLARMDVGPGWWANIFTVRVDGKLDAPPLAGEYEYRQNHSLLFRPRYPLQRGVRYRAAVRTENIPKDEGEEYAPVEALDLIIPRRTTPSVRVSAVYPSGDVLPENLLRFYVHFTDAMSRGDAYKYVRLIDGKNKPVEAAFLEIEPELWDADGTRLTLLIEPGRIKRGLKPREDVGPVLEQGKLYTLEINGEWPDAEGNTMATHYRKAFRVGLPDETQPDPKTWKVEAPAAGKAEALTVTFPKPLDHAMLGRVLWVTDDKGERVAGTVEVADKEMGWRFTPKEAWKARAYNLVVDTALEDPSGNSIARPFEVDVFHPIEKRVETKTVKVPFMVK